ncbi:MAG: hypothetical protein MRZ79_06120 [Bacteroidia bacterium]|nr:hypothetical protein [Bacteroidia bacterium]
MFLEIGFLALSLIMATTIVVVFSLAQRKMGASQIKIRNRSLVLAASLGVWFAYVYVVAQLGIMQDFSLPPKMPLMIILPLFLFTAVVLIRNRKHPLLKALDPSWVVYAQSFRLAVELLLLYTFMEGFIPKSTTFEGYNFDILAGITAPIVAYFVFQRKVLPLNFLLVWNILGLCLLTIVVSLFMTSAFVPQIWASEVPLVSNEFVEWPYVLLPGFLMPLAVFLHFLSIVQMGQLKQIEDVPKPLVHN